MNIYDNILSEGLIRSRRDNKWGFSNKEGEEVIPCMCHDPILYLNKETSKWKNMILKMD